MQSIGIFLVLVLLATLPAAWLWARRRDAEDLRAEQDADTLPEVMSAQQALARHLYGEACGWSTLDMLNYDHAAWVREPWERSAAARLKDETPPNG